MLNEEANIAFGMLFIPCLKMVVLLGLAVSFFAVVRLREDLDAISLFIMPTTILACGILIFPIAQVMSRTYDISQKFKKIIFTSNQVLTGRKTRNRYLERQVKACAIIRTKVGNIYYMEAQAKLTMIDYTVNTLVFLLVNS